MLDFTSVALLGAVTVTSIAIALGIAWTLMNALVTRLMRASHALDHRSLRARSKASISA